MNIFTLKKTGRRSIAMLTLATLFLGACASTQPSPAGSSEVRSKLTALQNNPNLNDRARVEIREAEEAVRLAEIPVPEKQAALGEHRVYMAERKVGIAEAKANTQYAEAQRSRLNEERDAARLQARTQEADQARNDAKQARADANLAEAEADKARSDNAQASAKSASETARLEQQIDELQAEATDRGLVLTLGDVLFATGSAELRSGTNANLDKVVTFLKEYPERSVVIEGHTDNVGSAAYNQALSQRRADSVRTYFTQHGIVSSRQTSSGKGMHTPLASNDDATGRQQNRRVEIIIGHTPATL